jgi:chromosome segregation ATPase
MNSQTLLDNAVVFLLAVVISAALTRLAILICSRSLRVARRSEAEHAENVETVNRAQYNRMLDEIHSMETRFAEVSRAIQNQHEGLIGQRNQIAQLIASNNATVAGLNEVTTQSNVLGEDLTGLHGTIERLMHIVQSTIDACGAAQRFYDVLTGLGRVPEQELRELGEALADWQSKGRLH